MKKMVLCVAILLLPLLFSSCATVDDGMGSMKKSFPGKENPNSPPKEQKK